MGPNGGGDSQHPYGHQRCDQLAPENKARLVGDEPLPGEPVCGVGPGPGPIPPPSLEPGPILAPSLEPCADDLHERIERAAGALHAIHMRIREMDDQAELIAEEEVPRRGYALPDQRLQGREMDDQAELIAEGDVPKQGYVLPDLRLQGCPH